MLALDLIHTGGKHGWRLRRGRQIVAQSTRGYMNKRSMRLSLVRLIKDIQADAFEVFEEENKNARSKARRRCC